MGNSDFFFHGCRTVQNKISIIQKGFDVKYASQGLHGWGLYFAKNAEYCNGGRY